jgi:F-type H+-transporting ATPase subunit c
MNTINLVPLAVGHMIGLGAVGSCIGIGMLGSRFMDAAARQPELAANLQVRVFLLAGLLGSLCTGSAARVVPPIV